MNPISLKSLSALFLAFVTFSDAKTAVVGGQLRGKCLAECMKLVKPLVSDTCRRAYRSKVSSLDFRACNDGKEIAMRHTCETTCAVIPGANEMMKPKSHGGTPNHNRACYKHKKTGNVERFQFCHEAYNKSRDVLSEIASSAVVKHGTVEVKVEQLPGDELTSNQSVESSSVTTFVSHEVGKQSQCEAENAKASGLEASKEERSDIIEVPIGFNVISDDELSPVTSFKRIEVASDIIDQGMNRQFQSEEESGEALGLDASGEKRSDIVEREAVEERNVFKLSLNEGIVSPQGASHLNEEMGGESRSKTETTKVLEARAPVRESKVFLDYEQCMADCSGRMKRIELDSTFCAKTEYHTPPTIFEACQDGAINSLAYVCPWFCRKRKFPESDKAENVSKRVTTPSEACSNYKKFDQQFMSCRVGYIENTKSLIVSISSTFLKEGPVEESIIHPSSDEELSSADCIHSSKVATFDKDMNEHLQNDSKSFKALSFEALMENKSEIIVEDQEVPGVDSTKMSVGHEQPTNDNIDSPKIAIDFHLKKDEMKAETINTLEAATLTLAHVSQWESIFLQDTHQKFKANSMVSTGSTALSKQFVVDGPTLDRFDKFLPTMEPVFVDVVPSHHSRKFIGNRLCNVKKAECIIISTTWDYTEDVNEKASSIDYHQAKFFRLDDVCANMTGQCRDGGHAWYASFSPWSENHTEDTDVMSLSSPFCHVGHVQTGVVPLFVDTGPVNTKSFTSNVHWMESSISLNKWQLSPSMQHGELKCEQLLKQLNEPEIELSSQRSMTSKDTIYSFNKRIGTEFRGMSSTGRLHNVDCLTDKSWIGGTEAHQVAISRTKARIELPCNNGSKLHFISAMLIQEDAMNFRLLVPMFHLQDPEKPCNQFENDTSSRKEAIYLSEYYFSSCLADKVEDAIDLIDYWISFWYLPNEFMIELSFQRHQEMIGNSPIFVDLPHYQAEKANKTAHLKGGIKVLFDASFYPQNALVHIHSGNGDNPSLFRMVPPRLRISQNHCIWSVNFEYLDVYPARSTKGQTSCTRRDCFKKVEVYPIQVSHLAQFRCQACPDCAGIYWQQNVWSENSREGICPQLSYGVSFQVRPVSLKQIEQQFSDDEESAKISFHVWNVISLGSLNCTRLQCVSSGVLRLCLRSSLPSHRVRLSLDDGRIASSMNMSFMLVRRDAIDTGPSYSFLQFSLGVCFFIIVVYFHHHLRRSRFEVAAYVHIFRAPQDNTMLVELQQQVACNKCFIVVMCFQDKSMQSKNEPALSKIQSSEQHSNLDAFYYLQFIHRVHRGNCKRSYRRDLLLLLYSSRQRKLSPLQLLGMDGCCYLELELTISSSPHFFSSSKILSSLTYYLYFFHALFSNT